MGLLGNKIDLNNREVTIQEGFKCAEEIKALFQECSAKTGAHISSFFRLILETLIKNVSKEEEEEESKGQTLGEVSKKKETEETKGCC